MEFMLVYWLEPSLAGSKTEGDMGGVTADKCRTHEDAVARARELFSEPRASYLALHGPRGLFLDTLRLAAEAGVPPPASRRVLGATASAVQPLA